MKKMLVLEDSRKVGYGGGQKGSLEVLEALVNHFEIIAADSVPDSIFSNQSTKILGRPIHRLRSYGSIVSGEKFTFSIGMLELLSFPFLTLWNLAGLLRLLRRNAMDSDNAILYAPLKKTLVLAWILSSITGIPFLYHARTIDDRDSRFFKILAVILRRAHTILCVSDAVAKNLDMPECQVLYNAVAIPENVPEKQLPDAFDSSGKFVFVVAAFASLLPLKGLQYLVEAAGLVRNPAKVEVRIYGNGPAEKQLKQLCPPNCHLPGFAERVNELLASEIHAVCMPSICEEAFGRVPMEGNSFGIPAIVTNIGAQAEITIDGRTGYHVPPKNSQAIADAIDHMIDNPNHYHALSKQAIEHSRNFDLKAHHARLLEIFLSI